MLQSNRSETSSDASVAQPPSDIARTSRVQLYNPIAKRWVKLDTRTGLIVGWKRTPGPYKGIPKR